MTAPRTQPARVLIVDDHEIVRRGLADTIERETDFTVCGEAADGPSALSRIRETDPDVVVTDLSLREGDGLELIKQIRVIYDNYDNLHTEILAASIRTPLHVTQAALAGADVATIPPAILKALVKHPLTDKGLDAFLADWKKTGQTIA